ncbi:MAG TPA: catalase family protein [Pyrinomonadaceae bacterium]|nr:catalase family protein [Pyrinomonadaceae bacterium]
MSTARFINDQADAFIKFTRRFTRLRDAFDAVFREPLFATSQFLVNLRRTNEHLALAEEKLLPDEAEITRQITAQMCEFMSKHYRNGVALRAGNTKTHGLVRAEFEVLSNLPNELRQGVFQTARTYKALVRFAGPGPFAPADVDDNGILSISIKLLGVEGEKLLADDERTTQDFTGISAPTFTTPDVRENLKLQKHIYAGTPVLYFLSPFDSHLLDALQQGLYAKLYGNPLEARYFSCVPYLYGDGRAVQYSIRPRGDVRTRVPRRPSPNYLREAMAKTLGEREAVFDFMVQFQTDAHRMPLENASVRWPEKLSPYKTVATLRIPAQQFDSPQQLDFDRKLSFNPWHCIAAHRPLGNQNRARRHIYLETSKFRQRMNGDERVEPTEGDFP